MLVLIPVLPLVGCLLNFAFGRRWPKRVSGGVACAALLASFATAALALRALVGLGPERRVIEQSVYTWMASGDFIVPFTLRLDPLAAVMTLVVTGVGFLIHVYSLGYMHEETDPEHARYFSYLNLFAAFMLVLVLGASLPVMFIGWEGVGLCSYLLIGFWFGKPSAADAGKKAFVVNRVGDFAFIIGMLLAFDRFGTLDIAEIARRVAPLAPETAFGVLSLIALLLFIGATGKSAQIPLYVWLPDAMEGPTPVSALIHAATMVTAGVYMIGRNAVLYSHAPLVLTVVAIVGVATALLAATIGLVQNDIKRVLAYSTISQLGFMFLAMGVGAFAAGIFHLYTHAFFKALLFLGAGAVMHAMAGETDVQRMGGLRRHLPLTYWTFLVGALAIAGVPLLSGFFSKDEILFRTLAGGHQVLWVVAAVTSLLTAVYMFRLVFLTFHGERSAGAETHATQGASGGTPGGAGHAGNHLHDPPPSMAVPLVVLAIGSVLAGYVGVPHVLGGENRIERFLEPSFVASGAAETVASLPDHSPAAHGEDTPGADRAASDAGLELTLMGVSTIVAFAGIGLAAFFFLKRRAAAARLAVAAGGLYRLLLHKYYVDELYNALFVEPIRRLSTTVLWRGVDAAISDGAVDGTGELVRGGSTTLRRLQSGSIRAYAASLFVGVILILGYYLWR